MAMTLVLRSIPTALRGCARSYCTNESLRTSAILSSGKFKPLQEQQQFVKSKSATTSGVLPNFCQFSNGQQKMNFSVSSKLQSKDGNHSKLWSAERLLSIGLLGIVPAALIAPSQAMDCILAVTLVMHNHWGLEAVVVDYVRPILFGPVIPKIAHGLVYAMSIVTLVGLLYLVFEGCGISNAIKLMWRL